MEAKIKKVEAGLYIVTVDSQYSSEYIVKKSMWDGTWRIIDAEHGISQSGYYMTRKEAVEEIISAEEWKKIYNDDMAKNH